MMRSIRYITSWRKKEWIIHSQNQFLQAYACRIIVSNEELKLLKIRSKTAAIPLKNTNHYQVSMSSPCSIWKDIDVDEDGKEPPPQGQSFYNQEALVGRKSGRSYETHSNFRP